MHLPRRLLFVAALCAPTLPAVAQAPFPNQPIRFIVTTAPGSGLDSFSRLVARDLTARAGQQVVVDNRAGAGTTIGSATAAKAKPDGYTVLVNTSALAISPAIYPKLPYDTLRDLEPLTLGARAPNLLTVHPSLPVKNVKELVAMAKGRAAAGDPLLYASGGSGTNGHLAMALFLNLAGLQMTHVPYKGGSVALVEVVGGQVPVMMDTVSSIGYQVTAGKLRALGVSSAKRAAAMPNLPTIAEQGVAGYESAQWYGFLVPTGTPPEAAAWLRREITTLLRTPAMRELLAADGMEIVAGSPEEFAAVVRTDIAKWTKLVKALGLTAQ